MPNDQMRKKTTESSTSARTNAAAKKTAPAAGKGTKNMGKKAAAAAPAKKKVRAAAEEPVELTVQTVSARKKTPFPFAAILTTFFCTMLFMYMIFNYVQINEYSQSIKEIQSDLDSLSSKQKELQLELDKRNDVTEILEKAEELGMVRTDGIKKIYLDGVSEDMIEVTDKGAGKKENSGFFSDIMSALAQNFRDIAEYLNGN